MPTIEKISIKKRTATFENLKSSITDSDRFSFQWKIEKKKFESKNTTPPSRLIKPVK